MRYLKSNEDLQTLRTQVISSGVASVTGIYIESAKGAILRDVEGKEYIDFGGGIGTMNVGHSHPKVIKAIKEQAEKFTHTCFMVNPYDTALKLAEKLCQVTPGTFPKRALFINSGAEALLHQAASHHCVRECLPRPDPSYYDYDEQSQAL
jgi:4-aminobutyrate aminotransferase/(S)-3-amino-2-methylpropionate transaminase